MRKIAGPGHSSYTFADYDAITNPTGTVYTAQWGNDVQDELYGIQQEFRIAESAGTSKYVLATIKGVAIAYGTKLGGYIWADTYQAPTAFDKDDPESFWPAICLDAIDIYTDISATNWVSLVPHLRAKRLTYKAGKASGEKYAFDVTNWAISSNVATLTFANTAGENAVLAALAEDNLVHGSYNYWRPITLASAIGDITAGDYAITAIDTASRTVSFAFTHANNSGSGTFTVNFYHHRIAGSTTTARLFEASGRTLVSAGDAAGEEIAGLRRRDRFQGHNFELRGTQNFVSNQSTGPIVNNRVGTTLLEPAVKNPINDGTNGTPRTGTTTDPRAQVGHLYIHGRDYAA